MLGIYTNKPEVLGEKVSGALFKKGAFQFVLGGVEGKTMKPNPERVLKELERLGINPADAVFVGDGDVDIFTGKNAGMIACGVAWGFRGREEVEEAGADVLISHPRELLVL
ncbi:hypothetical protein AGMMS49942_29970 [Spirochaetia bacterium]|nr:hypothetical protein AGMMS49942_29970 [Spirochaetia bacterium]